MTLVQCTACHRHVRASDSECPFCGAASTEAPRPGLRVSAGTTRAVIFTVGAALIGATACGGTHSGGDAGNAGADAGPEEIDSGNVAMPYGAPPADHLV